MKRFHTSVWPAEDTTFSIEGVIGLCIDVGGQVASVLFGVVHMHLTRRILAPACIDEHIKCTEPYRRTIVSKHGRAVQILASYETDAFTQVESGD